MDKILRGNKKKLVTLLYTILFTVAALSPIFPGKAQGITLTIITRHASDIQAVFETEFLQTSLASDAGVTDIIWKAPAPAFWVGLMQAGGIDVAWGGGPTLFDSFAAEGLLSDMSTSTGIMEEVNSIPDTFAGASLKRYKNGDLVWVAAAISNFGFTVNEGTRSLFGLPMPTKWSDLTDIAFFTEPALVGVVNAPESTTNHKMFDIMCQAFGWENGWRNITLISANSNIYHGSTESLGAVIAGEVAVALTIDFYGITAQIQNPDCVYINPSPQSIVNGDPIALTTGGSYPDAAAAFVKYVLSQEGQSQWLRDTLNRQPVREDAFATPLGQQRTDLYEFYNQTKVQGRIEFNETLELVRLNTLDYYYEATINNAHAELVDAWKRVMELHEINPAAFELLSQKLGSPLITNEEAIAINDQMGTDPIFRAQKQSEWFTQAVAQYAQVKSEVDQYLEAPRYVLSVHVVDEDTNADIAGATVSVFRDGTLVESASSSAAGLATFSVTAGSYVVKVQAADYEDFEGTPFTVSQDTERTVGLTSAAPPPPPPPPPYRTPDWIYYAVGIVGLIAIVAALYFGMRK